MQYRPQSGSIFKTAVVPAQKGSARPRLPKFCAGWPWQIATHPDQIASLACGLLAITATLDRHPGEGRDPPGNRTSGGKVDPGLRRDDDFVIAEPEWHAGCSVHDRTLGLGDEAARISEGHDGGRGGSGGRILYPAG